MTRQEALVAKLQEELAQVGWRDLRPHAGRGVLFLVQNGVDTLTAALAIARDDRGTVQAWLEAAQLVRPSETELEAWERELDKRFECLIVQPFVVARVLP